MVSSRGRADRPSIPKFTEPLKPFVQQRPINGQHFSPLTPSALAHCAKPICFVASENSREVPDAPYQQSPWSPRTAVDPSGS